MKTYFHGHQRERGFSLMEMVLVVLIIGVVAFIPKICVDFLNGLSRQQSNADIQREAQVGMYGVIRDVRNCKKIDSVSSDALTLVMFNHHNGYDSNSSNLFSPTNVGTVTYRFMGDDRYSYLLRTANYPGYKTERRMLVNMLVTPDADHYLFRAYDNLLIDDLEAVDIALRFGKGYWKKNPQEFVAQAMKRARFDDTP